MNGPRARQFLHDWASLYPGDAWVPTSKWHTVPGHEQYEFNRHLITRRGVALLPEEKWCSRLSKATTPLVHFYGKGRFIGKAAIGPYAVRTYAGLSLQQRRRRRPALLLQLAYWVSRQPLEWHLAPQQAVAIVCPAEALAQLLAAAVRHPLLR